MVSVLFIIVEVVSIRSTSQPVSLFKLTRGLLRNVITIMFCLLTTLRSQLVTIRKKMVNLVYIFFPWRVANLFLVTPNAPSYLHGWSPNGAELAYCAERNGQYDIYTIPVDGGVEVQLTDSPGLDDGPEYSPDGGHIWFNSVRTGLMQIWRMNADGTEQTQMTFDESNNWFPHVSPDGQTIAYLSYRKGDVDPGDHPANKDVEIRLMASTGGDYRTLVQLFGGQGTINVNSWSPDSKRLAFVSYVVEEYE